MAGMTPKQRPITQELAIASTTAKGATLACKGVSKVIKIMPPVPIAVPIMPSAKDKMAVSIGNCVQISFADAPMALRKPISPVRALTDISITFIISMPLTTKEVPAIATKEAVQPKDTKLKVCKNFC